MAATPPRTYGEAFAIRSGRARVQRLVYFAVALTILVAGCSLAVAIGGGLADRKRPFTLLRVSGTPVGTLYRVLLWRRWFRWPRRPWSPRPWPMACRS